MLGKKNDSPVLLVIALGEVITSPKTAWLASDRARQALESKEKGEIGVGLRGFPQNIVIFPMEGRLDDETPSTFNEYFCATALTN